MKASCAEVQSQLYVALDVGYIDKTTFKKLSDDANEVAKIVSALRTSVDKQRK
ncbi:four helix bundle protein [Prosthecochloris sp. SCSIO W1101]|uniref:four helix bundle protein n=1 Tax=Prosthecochloris sp. SCSIO W1101 TaxID=2992242 RepID=UPI00223D48F2|nr:four helix bundle protein [Prosthecochloris sp. SCSIO W1101]UZJ41941.1 four helix bundle protein [Prosthecochloris sp. SCSIO W1101]